MVTAIPSGLPHSFAWLDLSSPCCRRLGKACHSTTLIAHAYARLSRLHLTLPPLQSMSGNKMVGLQSSFLPQLKAKIYLSMEAPQTLGTSSMAQHGKWATTQDNTLFGPKVCSHFPAGVDQLLCSTCTPIVSSSAEGHFQLSKQQEVPLICLRSTRGRSRGRVEGVTIPSPPPLAKFSNLSDCSCMSIPFSLQK